MRKRGRVRGVHKCVCWSHFACSTSCGGLPGSQCYFTHRCWKQPNIFAAMHSSVFEMDITLFRCTRRVKGQVNPGRHIPTNTQQLAHTLFPSAGPAFDETLSFCLFCLLWIIHSHPVVWEFPIIFPRQRGPITELQYPKRELLPSSSGEIEAMLTNRITIEQDRFVPKLDIFQKVIKMRRHQLIGVHWLPFLEEDLLFLFSSFQSPPLEEVNECCSH